MRFFVLSFLVAWAVLAPSHLAAQVIDTSFVPRGTDRSVNVHSAPLGTAETSINWLSDGKLNTLCKRPGFAVYTTGIGGVAAAGYYTGLYAYHPRTEGKRLFASFLFDDTMATFKNNPYGLILRSAEWGQNIVGGTVYPFHYVTAPINCATYNDILIIGRKYGRPLRYAGGNLAPLVEPAPGSWEYTPMAETTATAVLLDGEYFYAMRLHVADTVGAPIEPPVFDDSMCLTGLVGPIMVDSDWVFVHSPEITGKTAIQAYNRTYIDICRTRADRPYDDSFFFIGEYGSFANDTNTMTTLHFIDSIHDDSLGTASNAHPFVGFIDTVGRVADTTCDSLQKLGQPQWLSTFNGGGSFWNGISDGMNTMDSGAWVETRYCVVYYDTSTGSVSPPGPILRVPVAYRAGDPGGGADTIYDTAIQVAYPSVPVHKLHLQRMLCRSQVLVRRTTVTDTLFRTDEYPAYLGHYEGRWDYYCYWGNGKTDKDHSMRFQKTDGSYWCRATPIQPYDTITYDTQISAFRVIDTAKLSTDTVFTDNIGWDDWAGKPVLSASDHLGQMDYPVAFNDRLLMASGSMVYYSAWDGRGSQLAIWYPGNALAINVDDGDEITGMIVWGRYLYVFKNNSIHQITEVSRTEYAVASYHGSIGCVAPNTLKHIPGGGIVFLHTSGLRVISGPLQSQFKESGGTMPPGFSRPIQEFLDNYSIDDLREALIWFDENEKNMWLSFPTLDTSFVLDYNGQWHQQTVAPKYVVDYDTTYETDLRPDKQKLFILNSRDDIYKFGGVKTDTGDTFQAAWKSLESFQTSQYGKISEAFIWKYSDDENGLDFNIYDMGDTVAATVRDTLSERVTRQILDVPESKGFKIEIKTYADSAAIDRIDLRYETTGPMPEG